MKGFLNIVKFTSGGNGYGIAFAPVGPTGTGGAAPLKHVERKEDLAFLLRKMRLPEKEIKGALEELEDKGNASMAFVDLPENQLRQIGLVA